MSKGVFDRLWTKVAGSWVKTERMPGRGMQWLTEKGPRTSVREAKRWPEGRPLIRKAVLGQWLCWEDEGSEHQPRSTEFSGAGAGSTHSSNSTALVRVGETAHAEVDVRRRVGCDVANREFGTGSSGVSNSPGEYGGRNRATGRWTGGWT